MKLRIFIAAALLAVVSFGAAADFKIREMTDPGATMALGCGSSFTNGTASAQIKGSPGVLCGIFVASSTSCTIKLWNALTATTPVLVNTFSANAATWYPLPFVFSTGLYLTVGGTCDYTVSYS